MNKPWLKHYPDAVPPTVDIDAWRSLPHLIDETCRTYADRPAFGNFGTTLSFTQFERAAAAFARWLHNAAGITNGERVALMMPNMLAYPIALYGVLRCGGVVVNTNPQYTAPELEHQLADSGARVLVVFEQALGTVAAIRAQFPDLVIVVARIGDFMPWAKALLFNRMARRRNSAATAEVVDTIDLLQAIEAGERMAPRNTGIEPEDLAFLQYTGGTTGRAKGAMLTHRNILANIAQVNAWFGPLSVPGEEIIITALPLYHIYALTGNFLAFFANGGMNYLITDPRNLKTFIKEIKRVPFSSISGVNTLFNALLEHPQFASVDFSRLKFTSGGGMAVQRAVAEKWREVTGSAIAEGYGLTESSPVVAANPYDTESFSGTIGLPVPSTEVRLIDDHGREVADGEPGELCVRGPQVMRGYWNNPAATAEVLDADGWLRTGDIAVFEPNGHLRIVDRKKDLILVSGFNVYPNEIEDVAVMHPQVSEAAAIGISDSKSGEAVRLVVVRNNEALSESALADWCREHLTGYKVPRSIVFAEALPKSNVGKILRREVRERFGV